MATFSPRSNKVNDHKSNTVNSLQKPGTSKLDNFLQKITVT